MDLTFDSFVAFLPGFIIRLTDKLKPYTGDKTWIVPLTIGTVMMIIGFFAFPVEGEQSLLLYSLRGFVMGYSAIYAYDQAKKSTENKEEKTLTLFTRKKATGATKTKTAI